MNSELTRICFVRHGETDWNIELRMQGHIDLALNSTGEAQAVAVGRHFSDVQAAALYSSDLLRARQTAQPISAALKRPMVLVPKLRERNFGRCEGLTFKEIAEKYPGDARAIASRDPDYAAPGGESRRQHQTRVLDGIGELVRGHPGQTIVVVTHGGVLDVINRRARDLPPEALRDYPIPNTGINWVAIAGERWVIESWGEMALLD